MGARPKHLSIADLREDELEAELLADRLDPRHNREQVLVRLNEIYRSGTAPDPLPDGFMPEDRPLVRAVLAGVEDSLDIDREERIVLAGTANLARSGPDFAQTIGPVLEALEEHVVLLNLLSDMSEDASGVGVLIGHETAHAGLAEASVVASGYGSQGEVVARLGVLGPTRMDYPTTIAAVRAVARYVSRILVQ